MSPNGKDVELFSNGTEVKKYIYKGQRRKWRKEGLLFAFFFTNAERRRVVPSSDSSRHTGDM